MATVFWDAEGTVLTILSIAAPSQEPSTLIWSENFKRHWRRKDEESYVAEWCFTRTTHVFTRHLKYWLLSEMPDSNYSITHHIRQKWLWLTSVSFLNWKNSWKNANLLTTKTLYVQKMAGWKSKINNSSTVEFQLWRKAGPCAFQLQEIMLKSDKIWYTYLVIKCVTLRTFWTTHVYRAAFATWRG